MVNERTFTDEVAQIRSKSLLKETSEETTNSIKWAFDELRIVKNVTGASIIIRILLEEKKQEIQELQSIILKIASIWESLAKLNELTDKKLALMNAAVNYQLAGYQANATCIARLAQKSNDRGDSIEGLSGLFLQRLFLQIGHLTRDTAFGNHNFRDKFEATDETLKNLVFKAYSNAAKYFLQGNPDLIKKAQDYFEGAGKILAKTGESREFNLVKSISSLLPTMEKRSTWNQLKPFGDNSALWERYLITLARGIGLNLLKSSSISELWPSQISALENGLLDSNENKIIRMPTSAGKTRVAEMAIVHTLIKNPGSKCIYVAPYKALAWELEQSLLNVFSDLGFQVSSVVGAFESDDLEDLLIQDADILVMTPEKLDLIQRAKSDVLEKVRLFVLDEGHIVSDGSRGIKFELLLTRIKRRLRNARFLYISAVVPREMLVDFALWFNTDPTRGIIDSRWRPSIQRYAFFSWPGDLGTIRYDPNEDVPDIGKFVPGIVREQEFEFRNPVTGKLNHKTFPRKSERSECAAELLYKFADLGPALVFCAIPDHTTAVAKALQRRINYMKLKGDSIPPHFIITRPVRSIEISREWLGPEHEVTKLLQDGIAVHNRDLPEVLRKAIEADFRDSNFRVIAATNTLAQGVNLPIKTVIIHTARRFDKITNSRVRISDRDYWNIAGRAGRATVETEGTIIHMIMNPSDSEDFEYYKSRRDNVEPVYGALFGVLKDLTFDRLTPEAFHDKLNPEIIALLVEESGQFSADSIDKVLEETLVSQQAKRLNWDIKALKVAFHESAKMISNLPTKPEYLPVYSATGLSTDSCEQLRLFIEKNVDSTTRLLLETNAENVISSAKTILNAISPIQEMQSDDQFGGDLDELFEDWLQGKGVYEISTAIERNEKIESLAKFVEGYFSYRLPWGMSSFLKIASAILEIAPDRISLHTKFLPSMVKFGVPNPIASWAMAIGIPFRRMAMALASDYVAEIDSPNYRNFLEWLRKISSEDLREKYDLRAPVLDDVTKLLYRTGRNALIQEKWGIDDYLKEETWVTGISFGDRRIVAKSAKAGQEVRLIRDYENLVDRNAIRVVLHGEDLGYIDRNLAQALAPYIDTGIDLSGSISYVEKGKTNQIKIKIERK